MLQALLAAIAGTVAKLLFGRWLTPKEKPDDALLATKAEAHALAGPPSSERAVADRLRDLEQPD